MTNRDIQGTWPKWNKFDTTREASNPLDPKYKLASFEYVPPEPLPFKRDQMSVDDIAGAKAIRGRIYGPRESLVTADIPGAKRKEPYYKKTAHNYIDYNDVTKTSWVTTRHTNPLEPVYSHVDESSGHFTKVRQMCGINTSYGAIYGSKPSTIPKARQNPERLFGTQDIPGA